ncbi:dihydrofolate reductase family protein [Flavobacterium sp.]|uniref:dihydrofolate reductase family protein n=1 Tax=Flavobacterium sp. TaxID=239 RepID=UPI00345AA693
MVWGSISLARALVAANLVHEYQTRVLPVILGEGESLFNNSDPIDLELSRPRAMSRDW